MSSRSAFILSASEIFASAAAGGSSNRRRKGVHILHRKELTIMKTKEELNALKEEVETVSRKLHELTDEELEQVTGGCAAAIAGVQFASVAEGKPGDNGFRSLR